MENFVVENVNMDWLLHPSTFSKVLHTQEALTSITKEFLYDFRIKMTLAYCINKRRNVNFKIYSMLTYGLINIINRNAQI